MTIVMSGGRGAVAARGQCTKLGLALCEFKPNKEFRGLHITYGILQQHRALIL